MTRQLSSYEKTHLARFGKSKINIADFGEMPVEYITGQVEFGGLVFSINHHVLIPRLETEELVKIAIELIKEKNIDESNKIVIGDIGCGCGAIGISVGLALAQQKIPAQIYLSDISELAVAAAQANLDKLVTTDLQPHFVTLISDLMNSFAPTLKFDFLLANLPYIPTARIDYLEESVKDHEPHLALDGGQEGLTLIGKFLTQALNFLKPDGQILLEVDYTHSQNELAACLPLPINNSSTQATVKIIKDSFNRQRFALIQLAA